MGTAFDNLEKLAGIFEQKLNKVAQEQVDDYPFQAWLDKNFPQGGADKNKIANNIANSIANDLESMYVNLFVKKKQLVVDAGVVSCKNNACSPNAADSMVAKKIVYDAVHSRISNELPKFPEGSKYTGWIRYPK